MTYETSVLEQLVLHPVVAVAAKCEIESHAGNSGMTARTS